MQQILVSVLAIFVSIAAGQFGKFMQNDYDVIYERAEVVSYDSEFFSNVQVKNYKYNRTQAVTNATFTIKKDLSPRYKLQVEAFKFMSNEYRSFPMTFSYNFCNGLSRNDFGMQKALKCGNLSTSACPFKKGSYYICKFFPDSERFPANIPEGSYKLDIKWFDGQTEIFFLQGYGTVKNKFLWERK